jgi:hypothetical protein
MFSIGDIAWWGKAKPQPWPVQIMGVSKDDSLNTFYRCQMFGSDGDVNATKRDIKERHLFHFLQNVGKYRTGANATVIDEISKRVLDTCADSTRKRPREEDDMENLRREVDLQIQVLRTTMDEAKALMSEMRDLQVSFKASCRQYVQELLDVYRSNVEQIASVTKN